MTPTHPVDAGYARCSDRHWPYRGRAGADDIFAGGRRPPDRW